MTKREITKDNSIIDEGALIDIIAGEIPESPENIQTEITVIDESGLVPVHMTEPIWEQQIGLGELDDDYFCFKVFLSLPRAHRTLQNAWEKYKGKHGNRAVSLLLQDKVPGYRLSRSLETSDPAVWFETLSNTFYWHKRATARDDFFELMDEHEWLENDRSRRETDYRAGEILRKKALEALDYIEPGQITDIQAIIKLFQVASALQANAIPKTRLEKDEVSKLMESLPEDKRNKVVAILLARAGQNQNG